MVTHTFDKLLPLLFNVNTLVDHQVYTWPTLTGFVLGF